MTAVPDGLVDALLRGMSLSLSLIIGSLFWRLKASPLAILSGTALALSAIAFTLLNFPATPLGLRAFFFAAALCAPFWFWLVVQILFEDKTRLSWPVWLILGGMAVLAAAVQMLEPGTALRMALAFVLRGTGAALVIAAALSILKGRTSDLVAGRVVLRRSLFMGLCLMVSAFIVLTVLTPYLNPLRGAGTLQVLAIVLFQLFAVWLLYAPHLALRMPEQPRLPPSPDAQRLIAFMQEKRPWQDPALTVAGLAAQMAMAEYKLRKIINQTLGYRNFPAFLNSYRLEAAAAALVREPRRPILSVALDHGFGSIGPFNRAFRERYGKTPTQYRKQVD